MRIKLYLPAILLLLLTGCSGFQIKRGVTENVFYSSSPRAAIDIDSGFEYEKTTSKERGDFFEGSMARMTAKDQRYIFSNRKEKRAVIISIETLDSGYWRGFDDLSLNVLETEWVVKEKDKYCSKIFTFYNEDLNKCLINRYLYRITGGDSDVFFSVIYVGEVDGTDADCKAWESPGKLSASQLAFLTQFKADSDRHIRFVDFSSVKIPESGNPTLRELERGKTCYRKKDYVLAERHFNTVLGMEDADNAHASALYWLGCTKFRTNELEKADYFFNEYVNVYPKKHVSCRAIGRFYYDRDEYEKAELYLKKALEENSQYSMAWNNLGWVYGKKETFENMRDAFVNARKYREGVEVWDLIGLGQAYYNLHEYDKAEEQFRAALEARGDDEEGAQASQWLGKTLFKQGRLEKAEEAFQQYISTDPDKHIANRRVGRFYYDNDCWDTAEAYLKQALKIDDEYSEAWKDYGWLFESRHQYEEMKQAFQNAIKFRDTASSWDKIGLGQACYYLNEFDTAEKLFREVTQDHTSGDDHLEALEWLGCTFFQKGDPGKAAQTLQSYVQKHDKKNDALVSVGLFYAGVGEFETAETYFKEAASLTPDDSMPWFGMGLAAWGQQNYAAMQDSFIKARALDSHDEFIIINSIGLGAALCYLGQDKAAETALQAVAEKIKNESQAAILNSIRILLADRRQDDAAIEKLWSEAPPGLGIDINAANGKIFFVETGHLGALAGLKKGDILLKVAGEEIKHAGSLKKIEKSLKYGEVIDVLIRRDGKPATKQIRLDYKYYR